MFNWSLFCFETTARRFFKIHVAFYVVWSSIVPILVLLLSQRFKSGDFVFMQNSAPCSAHRAKATRDDLRNTVPDYAVEKTYGSTAAVTKQDGDQFSTLSLNAS